MVDKPPWNPVPSVTTFGNAPVVTDPESRKAYQSWLIARVVYEIARWVCWTLITAATLGKVAQGLGSLLTPERVLVPV